MIGSPTTTAASNGRESPQPQGGLGCMTPRFHRDTVRDTVEIQNEHAPCAADPNGEAEAPEMGDKMLDRSNHAVCGVIDRCAPATRSHAP